MEEELRSGKRKEEHAKDYAKYYEITETPIRGFKFKPKQAEIDTARKNFGFFALQSNGVKDPVEAISLFRSKDLIEKAFSDMKDRLSMRRTSVSSDENMVRKAFPPDRKNFSLLLALIPLPRYILSEFRGK